MQNDKIVFFDGNCKFCNSVCSFLKLRDISDSLRFEPLGSNFTINFFSKNNLADFDCNTLYFYTNNRFYVRSAAVFKIFRHLKAPYPIIYTLSFLLPTFIADYFYDIVANNRDSL